VEVEVKVTCHVEGGRVKCEAAQKRQLQVLTPTTDFPSPPLPPTGFLTSRAYRRSLPQSYPSPTVHTKCTYTTNCIPLSLYIVQTLACTRLPCPAPACMCPPNLPYLCQLHHTIPAFPPDRRHGPSHTLKPLQRLYNLTCQTAAVQHLESFYPAQRLSVPRPNWTLPRDSV
jgi:hypothetical protein